MSDVGEITLGLGLLHQLLAEATSTGFQRD